MLRLEQSTLLCVLSRAVFSIPYTLVFIILNSLQLSALYTLLEAKLPSLLALSNRVLRVLLNQYYFNYCIFYLFASDP